MKTKEQILEWLDKQPWKNEFYENHFKHKIGDRICFNENFIRSAFDWPIGGDVWLERENEYLKWYNSNDKPMSWKEYCEQNPITANDYFINKNCDIFRCDTKARRDFEIDANVMPRNLCEAFVAYMKLIQLRNAWVKNNKESDFERYRICVANGDLIIKSLYYETTGLSFLSQDMAQEFLDTFKDLLETAKPLL